MIEQPEIVKLRMEIARLRKERDAWRAATGLSGMTPEEAGRRIDADDEERDALRSLAGRLAEALEIMVYPVRTVRADEPPHRQIPCHLRAVDIRQARKALAAAHDTELIGGGEGE